MYIVGDELLCKRDLIPISDPLFVKGEIYKVTRVFGNSIVLDNTLHFDIFNDTMFKLYNHFYTPEEFRIIKLKSL